MSDGKFVNGQIPWNKGNQTSLETRLKLSVANKGKKKPPRTIEHILNNANSIKGKKRSVEFSLLLSRLKKGKPSWNKGKKMTIEHRRKLSEAKRGDRSILWKGGLVSLNNQIKTCFKYRQWRSDVFLRDNFICVFCGITKVFLNADHIKPKAAILRENNIKTIDQALLCEELWNINNGRTLCEPCHKKTPTYANTKN